MWKRNTAEIVTNSTGKMRSDRRLNAAAWFVIIIGTFAWLTAVMDDSFLGKKPDDEYTVFAVEKDVRTGEIFDVQVTHCRVCGAVISYVRFRHGKVMGGYYHPGHTCTFAKHVGSGFTKPFNFFEWLGKWQQKLSHR